LEPIEEMLVQYMGLEYGVLKAVRVLGLCQEGKPHTTSTYVEEVLVPLLRGDLGVFFKLEQWVESDPIMKQTVGPVIEGLKRNMGCIVVGCLLEVNSMQDAESMAEDVVDNLSDEHLDQVLLGVLTCFEEISIAGIDSITGEAIEINVADAGNLASWMGGIPEPLTPSLDVYLQILLDVNLKMSRSNVTHLVPLAVKDLPRALRLINGDYEVLMQIEGVPRFQVPSWIAEPAALKSIDPVKEPPPKIPAIDTKVKNMMKSPWPTRIGIAVLASSCACFLNFLIELELGCAGCADDDPTGVVATAPEIAGVDQNMFLAATALVFLIFARLTWFLVKRHIKKKKEAKKAAENQKKEFNEETGLVDAREEPAEPSHEPVFI